jgi:hypothetical protein
VAFEGMRAGVLLLLRPAQISTELKAEGGGGLSYEPMSWNKAGWF